jgi:hypothetical protein
MSQAERDFMNQIDALILSASPTALSKLAELDKKTQLDGKTFYDAYCTLSDEDRKQLMVLCQSKNA